MGDSCGGGFVFWCRTKLISDEAGLREVSASAEMRAGLSRVPFLPGEEEHPLQQREGGSGPGRLAWCEPWQVSAEFRWRRQAELALARSGAGVGPGAVSREEEGGYVGKSPASLVRSCYPAELSTSCFPEVSSSPNAWCWAQSWQGFLRSSFSVHPAFPHPDSILLAYFFPENVCNFLPAPWFHC